MADSVEVSAIETTDGTIGIIRDNAARQSIANLREGKETVGSVAWENVKGRPTKVSSFENDKKYQTDENVSNTLNSTLYAGSSTHGGPATSADKLTTARTISLGGAASGSGSFDGSANSTINVSSLDATKLTGVVPITNLPPSVVERMSIVKDDTERFALTKDSVQDGDVVKVQSSNLMYYVVDDSKLSSEAGYEVFKAGTAASVPWGGVTGKPSTFPPSTHTHTKSQITDLGVFGGASATAAGSTGLVPQPAAGDQDKYLSAKGTWESITGKISGTKVTSANSADKLTTARALTIGNTGKSFDGSSNVSWSLSEIGALPVNGKAVDSDKLDGFNENAFLRYRGSTSTEGTDTLWSQIGIREYDNAHPEGITDGYTYGSVVSLPGGGSRFDLWYNHHTSSDGDGLRYRTGWNEEKRAWAIILDSVNYNEFAPTKTGTGASGTWGINVTGSAGTVNGHTVNSDVPSGAKFTDTTYGAATQSSPGLMLAADKKAVDREFFRMLPKGGTYIPPNADLNTIEYIKIGSYYNPSIDQSMTMKNIPIGAAFIMYVLAPLSEVYDNESTDQWVYRLRIFIDYSGQYIFTQFVGSGTTPGNFYYGPWIKMTNSNDLGAVSNKSAKYTLAASNWSGSSAPYTYDLGPTYGANAIIGFDSAVGNTTQLEAARAADIQGSSTTKIYAYGDKPTVDIPIVIIYQ